MCSKCAITPPLGMPRPPWGQWTLTKAVHAPVRITEKFPNVEVSHPAPVPNDLFHDPNFPMPLNLLPPIPLHPWITSTFPLPPLSAEDLSQFIPPWGDDAPFPNAPGDQLLADLQNLLTENMTENLDSLPDLTWPDQTTPQPHTCSKPKPDHASLRYNTCSKPKTSFGRLTKCPNRCCLRASRHNLAMSVIPNSDRISGICPISCTGSFFTS